MQKRRWFQIHLSTALVLMFVASGLLWAQVKPKAIETGYAQLGLGTMTKYTVVYGWPAYYSEQYVTVMPTFNETEPIGFPGHPETVLITSETWDNVLNQSIAKGWQKSSGPKRWLLQGVAINLGVALAILGVVAYGCEWVIRRREARKP